MSALLPISAVELNLNAEYGYSTREFSKVPNVYVSNNYKSCLILAYNQSKPIENRIDDYRNHFTLFRSDDTIIVVRSETNLIHADNDAILVYDVITPTDGFRSSYKNWNVSFDKITYSCDRPDTFVGYSLIGSGEWWFFDNGIILNGKSGHTHNKICQSIFIYYELHVDHKITMPLNQSLMSMPPIIEAVLKFGTAPRAPLPAQVPNTTTTTTNVPAAAENSTPNLSETLDNNPWSVPQFNLSSLPSSLLSNINTSARPIIRHNDSKEIKSVVNKSVIPSLFWFDARGLELFSGSIEYFKPKNFTCEIPNETKNITPWFNHNLLGR